MADEPTSHGVRPTRNTREAYPRDLAAFVEERWEGRSGASDHPERPQVHPLPDASVLEEALSVCYQASLLREEEQPVIFRLALCDPESFPPEGGPPKGLQRLEFSEPRPFDAQELRRLSPATDYPRSIVGAGYGGESGLRIWGLVHTGPRWLRDRQGGRVTVAPLPPLPIVHVTGPGRLQVRKGSETIAKLEDGALSDDSVDIFESEWLPAGFATARAELMELHWAARNRARERDGKRWAALDPDLARKISQQMFKRLISTVQNFGRGGTVIFVPPERTEGFYEKNRFVALKYRFLEGEPRRRFRTLIVETMNRLAQAYGSPSGTLVDEVPNPRTVGWREYQESNDQEVADFEEAIMEVAHLVAALSTSDGAVVMSKRYELVGFGGEISGKLAAVETVLRALDVEGDEFEKESTQSVGTRHRSAYRLCKELPDVLAVVVSKDGDVRFVRQLEGGEVAYWDQD
jgi:DNA integrity scanning protein DisA with diadenylate cyclase activity